MNNPIETIQVGWQRELPDLDTAAMLTVARINRASILMRHQLEQRLTEIDISLGEFDVLSALRRQGPPYEMNPSALAKAAVLSPSGMTHRLDLLAATGMIERVVNPSNRRTAPVRLTKAGVSAAEQMAREIVAAEEQLLSPLAVKETDELDALLDKLLASLDEGLGA